MLLQAEFDLDLATCSIRSVMDSVQKSSGRRCKRVVTTWQEIDVEIPSTLRQTPDFLRLAGVKDAIQLDTNNFSIRYDAKVKEARSLLKAGVNIPISLAPSKSYVEVTTGIRKTTYLTLLSTILTIPILILSWAPLPEHKITYGSVSLALATAIQFFVAGPFYSRAFRSLIWTRTIHMDLLIVISTSTAYLYSVASFIYVVKGAILPIKIFFDTSGLLVTLIKLEQLMSELAGHRAIKSTSIRSLQASTTLLIDTSNPDDKNTTELDVRLLQYGDVFKMKPVCPVVTDGIVISGYSEADESMLTGEAKLVEKESGSSVIAGSINRSGTVVVQLTRLPGENTIDDIARMVDKVTQSKHKSQDIADHFAGYFVPVVGALATLTWAIHFAAGKLVQGEPTGTSILRAIPCAISVLVVSCPCAIVLAVPMVLIVTSSVAAQRGVIFKSAEAMRVSKDVTHVVFDKTGTLTDTRLSVMVEDYIIGFQRLTGALVLALTNQVKHPVSSAVAKHLENKGIKPATMNDLKHVIGKGVEGMWNGELVRVGNACWLGVETIPPVQSLLSRNLTVL